MDKLFVKYPSPSPRHMQLDKDIIQTLLRFLNQQFMTVLSLPLMSAPSLSFTLSTPPTPLSYYFTLYITTFLLILLLYSLYYYFSPYITTLLLYLTTLLLQHLSLLYLTSSLIYLTNSLLQLLPLLYLTTLLLILLLYSFI